MALLSQWAVSMRAFRRNRVPVEKKVVAAALCNGGYSYREVAKMLGGLSYIAARDAYLAFLTSMPAESKRNRREVAIDGGDVGVEGRNFHVWLARDVDTGEIMSFHASPGASPEDSSRFLASVAAQCSNKPSVRLGYGASYPKALLNLDLYFQLTPGQSIISRLGKLILRTGK
jgi:putative transposase